MTKSAISCGVLESTSDSANPSRIPSENKITVSPSASETEHDPAQAHHGVLAEAHEIDERLARIAVARGHRRVRGACGLLAVAEAVDNGHQRPFADTLAETEVARLGLPRQRQRRERGFDLQMMRRHFFIVIVVPCPTTDTTSNSSIRRLAPGRPAPTPCEVEYPYCIACSMSGMPGP